MQVSMKMDVLSFIETMLVKENTEGAITQLSAHVPHSNLLDPCQSLLRNLIAQVQFSSS